MNAPESSQRPDLVFVASGGRTGTTFFGQRLTEVIEGCYSEHEPDVVVTDWAKTGPRIRNFGLWHTVFGRMLGFSGLRVLGHRVLAGKISAETCIRRLREQRKKYHTSIDQPLAIESNGRYWMVAPLLEQAFPGSRVVGIVRDPRDWIESWIKHQPKRHTKGFGQWFPQGPLTPRDTGDEEWVERWDDLDQFGRIAWDWRAITRRLGEAADSTSNVRVFRFEDIFNGDAVREVVEFVSFDGKYPISDLTGFTESVRNPSKGKRNWRDWSHEDAKLVDAICGELMAKYGYGTEPEWQALVAG